MKNKFCLLLVVLFLFVTLKPAFANESSFYEININSDNKDILATYREIVKERSSEYFYFTQEEIDLYRSKGYILHTGWITYYDEVNFHFFDYYYPVICTWENELYLIYTSNIGYTYYQKIDELNSWSIIGSLHDPFEKPDDSILATSTQNYSILFSSSNGIFTTYKYGEPTESIEVPKDSVYCGHSFWEGYIIRSGTDVYAVNLFPISNILCIAHNVSFVIDAEYHYSSDRWSQPLFLMADGSIKVYISNTRIKKELNKESDDPIFLYDPLTEGAYR